MIKTTTPNARIETFAISPVKVFPLFLIPMLKPNRLATMMAAIKMGIVIDPSFNSKLNIKLFRKNSAVYLGIKETAD